MNKVVAAVLLCSLLIFSGCISEKQSVSVTPTSTPEGTPVQIQTIVSPVATSNSVNGVQEYFNRPEVFRTNLALEMQRSNAQNKGDKKGEMYYAGEQRKLIHNIIEMAAGYDEAAKQYYPSGGAPPNPYILSRAQSDFISCTEGKNALDYCLQLTEEFSTTFHTTKNAMIDMWCETNSDSKCSS